MAKQKRIKQYDKYFELDQNFVIRCTWKDTRYGFKHEAHLLQNYNQVGFQKACYYNRTWERYEFQSVIHGVIDSYFTEADAKRYKDHCDAAARGELDSHFGMLKGICALTELLCNTEEQKVAQKKRLMEAGLPGIDFPDDFNQLPIEEQKKRIDGALKVI